MPVGLFWLLLDNLFYPNDTLNTPFVDYFCLDARFDYPIDPG
jgi:hypothetical protein